MFSPNKAEATTGNRVLCEGTGTSFVRAVLLMGNSSAGPRQDLDYELAVAFLRAAGIDTDIVVLGPNQDALVWAQSERPAGLVYIHVSSRSAVQRLFDIEPALGSLCPRPLIVAGGLFASENATSMLTEIKDLDAVIIGEIEATLLAVTTAQQQNRAWWQEPGLWRRYDDTLNRTKPRPPIENLDSLPMAATDLLDSADRTQSRHVLVGRGCDSDCSYCCLQVPYRESFPLRRRFWRSRSPHLVVSEMERLYRLGIEHFVFNSFVFFGYDEQGTSVVEEIARNILARELPIRFSFVTHPGHFRRNLELLPLLMRAGLDGIYLGIDSILDRPRALYRLPFTAEDIYVALTALHQHSVNFRTGYIFYDPYLSLDEIGKNLLFLRAIRPLYSHLGTSYGHLLHYQVLNTTLQLGPRLPILEQLRRDDLLVREGTLKQAPIARFSDRAVGLFYHLHRRVNREILPNVTSLVFHPELEKRFPALAFFLLDLFERLRLQLQVDPEVDESEALLSLKHWVRNTLAPVYVASQEPGFPALPRHELVDNFFRET